VERPSWILERALTQPLALAVVRAGLGPAESEAIGLAYELRVDRVILDDLPVRFWLSA
jgi:predicted nucleic acid-binding protein